MWNNRDKKVQERISRAAFDQGLSFEKLDKLATWLDSAIVVPGTNFRVGWDTLIGLVPGIGDLTSALISSWIVLQAKHMGVSKWTLARMISNVGVDAVIGSVPLVGDLFDATFKSNRKNIELLRRHLEKQQGKTQAPSAQKATRTITLPPHKVKPA